MFIGFTTKKYIYGVNKRQNYYQRKVGYLPNSSHTKIY